MAKGNLVFGKVGAVLKVAGSKGGSIGTGILQIAFLAVFPPALVTDNFSKDSVKCAPKGRSCKFRKGYWLCNFQCKIWRGKEFDLQAL